MNSKNIPVSDTEKLPSDEQLRRTVDRVLGRSQAAASVTTYDAAGTAHHSDNSSSTHGNNSRRVLDTRAREISDVQREHSEYDGDRKTSLSAAHCAVSRTSPPNLKTSPRSSTASYAWSAWC